MGCRRHGAGGGGDGSAGADGGTGSGVKLATAAIWMKVHVVGHAVVNIRTVLYLVLYSTYIIYTVPSHEASIKQSFGG